MVLTGYFLEDVVILSLYPTRCGFILNGSISQLIPVLGAPGLSCVHRDPGVGGVRTGQGKGDFIVISVCLSDISSSRI